MRRQVNVLITAVSRRVTLVQSFRTALAAAGVRGRIVATDVNPLSPGVHLADTAYEVPLSTAPDYIEAVLDVCRREDIDLVVPTIDDELPVFASATSRFAEAGTWVAVSPLETTAICNDKVVTCTHLRDAGIAAAASFLPNSLPRKLGPPWFVKPRAGRGSVGAFAARTRRELEFFVGYVPDPCVQEYLTGPEFTLDVFCDRDGIPVSVVPRERVVIRSGVIDRGLYGEGPAPDRARPGLCAGPAVRGTGQHPVPHPRGRPDCVRDQPPVLRRHRPHDPGRCGLPAMAPRSRHGPAGSARDRPLQARSLDDQLRGGAVSRRRRGAPADARAGASGVRRGPMSAGPALIILQARTGSTRLPGKVLADLAGLTVLERCIRRLQAAGVGPVLVATTHEPADTAVVALSRALGAETARGPVDDVLTRFLFAATGWHGPFVIRATADNPAVDPGACVRVLEWLKAGADYVAENGLPVGAAVEGMTIQALTLAGEQAVDPYDREHVTPWLRRRAADRGDRAPEAPVALRRRDLRFTVDTSEDLAYMRTVVAEAGGEALVPLEDLIRAADRVSAHQAQP